MKSAKAKLEKSLGHDAFPLDYQTTLRVVRDALHAVSPAPVVVSEGANTMDNARFVPSPCLSLSSYSCSLSFYIRCVVMLLLLSSLVLVYLLALACSFPLLFSLFCFLP